MVDMEALAAAEGFEKKEERVESREREREGTSEAKEAREGREVDRGCPVLRGVELARASLCEVSEGMPGLEEGNTGLIQVCGKREMTSQLPSTNLQQVSLTLSVCAIHSGGSPSSTCSPSSFTVRFKSERLTIVGLPPLLLSISGFPCDFC
jgi:hypothetical protein